jgi:hypothetical protein
MMLGVEPAVVGATKACEWSNFDHLASPELRRTKRDWLVSAGEAI